MTLTKQDDGGFWVSGPLVAVIVGAILSLFTAIYVFQNDRLWSDGQDIAQLKVTATNDQNETTRIESAVGSINQTLASVADSLRGLKDANDNLKDQMHELQKQVADLDLILRPQRTFPTPH